MRILCALVLVVASATAVPSTQAVPSSVRKALAIVGAVYPDLVGRRHHVAIEADGDVRLEIAEVEPLASGPVSPARTPELSVIVRFDSRGQWRSLDASGSYVSSADYRALQETLAAGPFRSAAEAETWFEARGARYGPASPPRLDERLNLPQLTRVTGTGATVQAGGFQWSDPGSDVRQPGWVVYLATTTAARPGTGYQVLLEPFGGRVVRIVREAR